MRIRFLSLLIFSLLFSACTAGVDSGNSVKTGNRATPEELSAQAEKKFAEYVGAPGATRQEATERTAAYLRGLPGVREVTVRGSDTIFVTMGDGSELLLMLGRNRL